MEDESATHGGSFTIGALSRRTGCRIDTIRYYERIRLMPKVRRTAGGHRFYDSGHITRVAFIRRSRRLGLSLDQVRELLGGIERNAYGCEDIRALLVQRAARIKSQIEELEKLESSLRTMIEACGDAELANCHVVEAMLAGEDAMLDARCCSEPSRRDQATLAG